MTSHKCSPPPSNIYWKPKALGSVLKGTHHTEKERVGSQGAYNLGDWREHCTGDAKRQRVENATIDSIKQKPGI